MESVGVDSADESGSSSQNGVGRRGLLFSGARVVAAVGLLGVAGSGVAPVAAAAQPVRYPTTGLRIPDTELARQAMEFVREVSTPTLFGHVMRSYQFGVLMLERTGQRYDRELLFVGAALHDLGLVERFVSTAERFELDGADVARRFLRERGMSTARADVVWDAIALHTNFTIAARKRPEIAAVAAGAGVDVSGQGLDQLDRDDVAEVLETYPRLGFKREAIANIIDQCRRKPMAYLLHPFAEVGRKYIPGFPVPTIEQAVLAAPFPE